MATTQTLYDFDSNCNPEDWYIVDDVVMGGRSNGTFSITQNGHGKFEGTISLENNGGFSSVRHQFFSKDVKKFSKFILRLKGDGSTFQFRAKQSYKDYASYVYEFETTTDWMTIEIPFSEMYPSFRGRRLNQPNFEGFFLSEIAFLIGNKKAQKFELLIDYIKLE